MLPPIEWLNEGKLRFLDQTQLPQEETWLETADYREVAEAIRTLRLRGAPLIGIAAAYGLALASLSLPENDAARTLPILKAAAAELAATRPTAVNLTWALDRLMAKIAGDSDVKSIQTALLEEALRVHEEDIAANRRLGMHGAALLPQDASVLTHCNAGSLATGGYGTALGVVRSARETGRLRHVYTTETRPLLQGARLTAWELSQEGIPFTLIVDGAAGSLLRRGEADAVVVGADRITASGDVANKIGTYSLAVLARENDVPFYVAAPTGTVDLSLATGDGIPIEERSAQEVTSLRGMDLAPAGTTAANPAFDVTPHGYITAIVTENGVAREPYQESLSSLCQTRATSSG